MGQLPRRYLSRKFLQLVVTKNCHTESVNYLCKSLDIHVTTDVSEWQGAARPLLPPEPEPVQHQGCVETRYSVASVHRLNLWLRLYRYGCTARAEHYYPQPVFSSGSGSLLLRQSPLHLSRVSGSVTISHGCIGDCFCISVSLNIDKSATLFCLPGYHNIFSTGNIILLLASSESLSHRRTLLFNINISVAMQKFP